MLLHHIWGIIHQNGECKNPGSEARTAELWLKIIVTRRWRISYATQFGIPKEPPSKAKIKQFTASLYLDFFLRFGQVRTRPNGFFIFTHTSNPELDVGSGPYRYQTSDQTWVPSIQVQVQTWVQDRTTAALRVTYRTIHEHVANIKLIC